MSLTTEHYRIDQKELLIFDVVRILSIDVGRLNLGLRISERKILEDESIFIQTLYMNKPKLNLDKNGFHYRLMVLLEELSDLICTCDYFLIEKQNENNTTAIRDMQFYIDYFVMSNNVKKNSLVVEVSPKIKSKYFDCPKDKNGKNIKGVKLKKWNVEIAKQICKSSGDNRALKIMRKIHESGEKIDELGDIISMEEGYIRYNKELNRFSLG